MIWRFCSCSRCVFSENSIILVADVGLAVRAHRAYVPFPSVLGLWLTTLWRICVPSGYVLLLYELDPLFSQCTSLRAYRRCVNSLPFRKREVDCACLPCWL